MGYSSIVYSSYTEFITEVRLVEQKLPTLSDIAYPFRNCLPFQKLPTLSDISAVRIAQSLDFYTMFCGSIFDLLSFISLLAIVLIIWLRASDYLQIRILNFINSTSWVGWVHPRFLVGSCCSILGFPCSVCYYHCLSMCPLSLGH